MTGESKFDLIILTNTSHSPDQIRKMVPAIKARYPQTRIIVVSGYATGEWMRDLRGLGVDGFLELPVEAVSLRTEVAALLVAPV